MAGVDLLLIIFLVPETQYHRDLHRALDSVAVDVNDEPVTDTPPSDIVDAKSETETVERFETRSQTVPKKTFWEELKPWSPVHKEVNLLASFIRPWEAWCYPSVVWSVFSFSIHVTGYA